MLGVEADDLVKKIADLLLETRFDPDVAQPMEGDAVAPKAHYVEDATTHFIVKQILAKDKNRQEQHSVLSKIRQIKVHILI